MVPGEPYKVVIAPKAKKRFKKLPKDSQQLILKALQNLQDAPNSGYPLKKPLHHYCSLKVKANRVEYRVIHQLHEDKREIWILLIEPREEVYKKLKQLIN